MAFGVNPYGFALGRCFDSQPSPLRHHWQASPRGWFRRISLYDQRLERFCSFWKYSHINKSRFDGTINWHVTSFTILKFLWPYWKSLLSISVPLTGNGMSVPAVTPHTLSLSVIWRFRPVMLHALPRVLQFHRRLFPFPFFLLALVRQIWTHRYFHLFRPLRDWIENHARSILTPGFNNGKSGPDASQYYLLWPSVPTECCIELRNWLSNCGTNPLCEGLGDNSGVGQCYQYYELSGGGSRSEYVQFARLHTRAVRVVDRTGAITYRKLLDINSYISAGFNIERRD